jgi:Tol biopolymer transport system component
MRLSLLFIPVLFVLNKPSYTMNPVQHTYGIFEGSSDIGPVKHLGKVSYNPQTETYSIQGSGTNMWFNQDEFHFLWKKLKGNIILTTEVGFIGGGVEPHRKAGIIIRKDLEPGSPYISAAYHGNGLVAMQYRLEPDSATQEFRAREDSLSVLQIVIHSDTVVVQAAKKGEVLQEVGRLIVDLFTNHEYYAGLFVCSHNPDVIEEAIFRNTRLIIPVKDDFVPYSDYIGSRLEILDVTTGLRKIIYESKLPIEAPNWSRTGDYFLANAEGFLYYISLEGGKIRKINTDFATSNNNDHGISPEGTQLAISHHAQDRPAGENSVIYILPIGGGIPRQITSNSPSYWHGWSPDGKYLIYTAKRNNQWGIYRIPSEGGKEDELTSSGALDDGSEYSSDGRYIWFNSNRTGTMEIWRMKEDGSDQVQITNDEYQNWFAHESHDGKNLVFLSYLPDVNPWDHPYYQHVMLRLLELKDGMPCSKPRVLAYLYGGQGTINVHSWSPDGTHLAFISNTNLNEN